MNLRSIIVTRLAIIYFAMLLMAFLVIGKIVAVQNIKTDRWEQIADNLTNNTVSLEPTRGNICADDGNVLATSVPGYYVRIDLAAPGVKKVYAAQRDSLALMLSSFFRNLPAREYRRRLDLAYKQKERGFMLTPGRSITTNFRSLKNSRFCAGEPSEAAGLSSRRTSGYCHWASWRPEPLAH